MCRPSILIATITPTVAVHESEEIAMYLHAVKTACLVPRLLHCPKLACGRNASSGQMEAAGNETRKQQQKANWLTKSKQK
jgi:hypothetical protein